MRALTKLNVGVLTMDFSRYDILVDNEEGRKVRQIEHEMMRTFNDELDLKPLTRAEREKLQTAYRQTIESRTDEMRALWNQKMADAREDFFAECRQELGYGDLPLSLINAMECEAEEHNVTITDTYYFLYSVCQILRAAGILPCK